MMSVTGLTWFFGQRQDGGCKHTLRSHMCSLQEPDKERIEILSPVNKANTPACSRPPV